jgi:NTP pyrophosphatase (non-canonical NTP hydrolase)
MTKAKYLRSDVNSLLGHVVEECGELLHAIGKTQRWGLNSYNPEIPIAERESNRTWIIREMEDLYQALGRLRDVLK